MTTPLKIESGQIEQFQSGDTITPSWIGSFNSGNRLYYDGTNISGIQPTIVFQGRLSLGGPIQPVTTSDVTGATTVYISPYLGNMVVLYDGTNYQSKTFGGSSLLLTQTLTGTLTSGQPTVTSLSQNPFRLMRGMLVSGTGISGGTTISTIDSATGITLSANATTGGAQSLTFKMPANKNADIYAVWSPNWLFQFGNLWTNDTTRADALVENNGVYVNNAVINSGDYNSIPATQGLYLGTVRTTSTDGQTSDSGGTSGTGNGGQRFLWNYFNRIPRHLQVTDTTSSWTYAVASWRQARAQTGNKFEIVVGVAEDTLVCDGWQGTAVGTADWAAIGVGIDSTTVNSAYVWGANANPTGDLATYYRGIPSAGYHAINWLEIVVGSTTFYGSASALATGGQFQAGLTGVVRA